MEAQLIGLLRLPKYTHVSHPNMLDAIRGLMQLLHNAVFASGSFDAHAILERDLDEVNAAHRSLSAKLAQLDKNYDQATRLIKPLDEDPIEYDSSDRAITPTAVTPKTDHTRSSQYASITAYPGSGKSLDIQRMALKPSEASTIRDINTPVEARAADPYKLHPGHLQSYFEAAMNKYEKDRWVKAKQAFGRSMTCDI